MESVRKHLQLQMARQPDDYTCGPTCLHAVYSYFNDTISLKKVISEVDYLEDGGTLAVQLGCHALKRGYRARIYTYNMQVFDPSWFENGRLRNKSQLASKLKEQAKVKKEKKLKFATDSYIRFLESGGDILFEDLNGKLIRKYLDKSVPILTGLSSTYLYRSRREYGDAVDYNYDDVRGTPQGHFVVLHGYDRHEKKVLVSDPYSPTPMSKDQKYSISLDRIINSILLGILTYDANLLVIDPVEKIDHE
jgi:hypothetical protein